MSRERYELALMPTTTAGPCPCDVCEHRARCAATNETCDSFAMYVNGSSCWRSLPRVPRERRRHEQHDE